MKIATFNANGIRARMPVILDWLQEHTPDVLAVQETKVQDSDFPVDAIQEAGYHVFFSGQKAYNGVAFITREPIEDGAAGFPDGAETSRILTCRYHGISIINTYVPQGREIDSEHYTHKLGFLDRVHRLLKENYHPDQCVIWLGDLNIAPEKEDVYDPEKLEGHVCFNREITSKLREIEKWGLFDVFRKHHPEPEQFTFFDYRLRGAVYRNLGWRLDHILVTKRLLEGSSDAWIDLKPRKRRMPKPSDHTFLVAEFSSGICDGV